MMWWWYWLVVVKEQVMMMMMMMMMMGEKKSIRGHYHPPPHPPLPSILQLNYELYYITPTDFVPVFDWDIVFEKPLSIRENTHMVAIRKDYNYKHRILSFYSRTIPVCE